MQPCLADEIMMGARGNQGHPAYPGRRVGYLKPLLGAGILLDFVVRGLLASITFNLQHPSTISCNQSSSWALLMFYCLKSHLSSLAYLEALP